MSAIIVPDNVNGYQYVENTIRSLVQGGRFFALRFLRGDGTMRDMVARLGVRKGLVSPDKPYVPKPFNGVLTVWDVQLGAYRSVRLDRVQYVKVRGKQVDIVYAGMLRRVGK